MIFVLKMLFTFVYDRKNENHLSLPVIRYSLLGIQTPVYIIYYAHCNLYLRNIKHFPC